MKWIQQEREESNDSEQEDSMENRDNQPHCQHQAKWLPQSLSILFDGQAKNPVSRPPCQQFTWETLMMELIAAEEEDEKLDAGTMEDSGDDYDE